MTSTLESALAGLPAKPRVHELSKRIGISNKELIAALAERGLEIKSASASVPLAVAQEVIQAMLGGAPADSEQVAEPSAASSDQAPQPAAEPDRRPSEIPGDTPGDSGHAINPLFLPPAEFAPQQPGSTDVEQEGAPDDQAGSSTRPGSSRRRRGRSGGGRKPKADVPDPSDAAGEQSITNDAELTAAAQDQPSEPPVGLDQADGQPEAAPTSDDEQAADAETDTETDARGRRRRRGRRGRGRVMDADDREDSSQSDESGQADDVGAEQIDGPAVPTEVESSDGAAAGPAAEQDDGESETESDDSDSDSGQAGSGGNRRRRRRRRRSTGDETPREDDPDNTVVHVREPRLSQSSSAAAPTPSNEVQGVRGSTRLEAKRQRHRDSRDSSRRRPQILTEAEFLARRESVERVMAVRQRGDLAQVALLEDGILVEHFVSQTGSDSMIGSVFLGKVQNVLPSMEAAFVDIGRGRNAVIYAGEVNWDAAGLNGKARRIETALSSGDTILAQVSKDPVGHKGARLTTQISLPGRFVVFVPGGGATGISRKLPDTERKRLKSIMDRIVPEDAGVIIRTAAEGIAEEELAADVERLKSQWDEITRRAAEKTSAPTQLYAEPGTLIKVVRDLFNSDITRLVVDGADAYEPVAEYITSVAPELADRLVRYEPSSPKGADVFAAYRIDEQIAKALERKVHLPSGGSLVIDRTEAMTVVDVNTGKYTGSGGNLEETVTKNNLEAAEEMVRQLRLRDIGGIIVIDFIDMVLESNRELVLRRLTEALGRDRTRHQVAEVTSLGLVQMTRKRMGTGLVEAFSEPCPHCAGRGIVLHDMPMVATAVEDQSNDRRGGKSRRGRGRDADRVEEVVIPRVVEQTTGRRPDPRGPKPPSAAGVIEREPAVRRGRGAQDQPDAGAVPSSEETEVDWIEAAARAGIAAAADADEDEDNFEASGRPGTDDEFVPAAKDVGPAAIDDEFGRGRPADSGPADSGPPDAGSTDAGSTDAGSADAGPADVEPAPDESTQLEQAEAPAEPAVSPPRRRGRRSAGRPAGAPPAAQPVDIIVQELPPAPDSNGSEQSVPPSEPAGAVKQGDANGVLPAADQAGSSGDA
ncbi:MAG: translation initiation factor IF-2 N-terminal domain-containing protein, partial [Nakamurella sp.]